MPTGQALSSIFRSNGVLIQLQTMVSTVKPPQFRIPNVLSTPALPGGGDGFARPSHWKASIIPSQGWTRVKEGSRPGVGVFHRMLTAQTLSSIFRSNGVLIQLQTMVSTVSHRISNGKCFIDTCFTEGVGEMGLRDSPAGKHPSFQIKDGHGSRKGLRPVVGVFHR
ncbi:hypothetical protein CDAR_189621 [Caerostris darwini]|uniref:Uncharacterized protein n=1 Tax=Caerostris darwini TaxID=1538125 RepID=A0AAV4QWQ2_9ARAC|nr:hypothetical protein CDAR_189621 [Caerostris darwini]